MIFVGSFSKGKQPLLSVKVLENLLEKGIDAEINMYGNGNQFEVVQKYITKKQLKENVFLHGNQPKEIVKKAYKKSHFLVFISKSEGWPKVVAEAMFWSCLPLSTNVSCVSYMLDYGKRGAIVSESISEISNTIIDYITDEKKYFKTIESAKNWSQKYTLEKFEYEIKKFL